MNFMLIFIVYITGNEFNKENTRRITKGSAPVPDSDPGSSSLRNSNTTTETETKTQGNEGKKPVLLEWEESNETTLFYPDEISKVGQNDSFYDRIVAITLFETNDNGYLAQNIAIGVLLDDSRVLTSFNPFRAMIKDKGEMANLKLVFMSSRKFYQSGSETKGYYGTYSRSIRCARSVIPMQDSEILIDQWHDPEQRHSPLHDLLVLRTDTPAILADVGNTTKGIDDANRTTTIIQAGPIITEFGTAKTHPQKELKLVSLGLIGYEPMQMYRRLRFVIYDQSELLDCQSWLPKSWGYFICLRNNRKFIGFASSAMLFSNETLIGVGSFTFWRGKAGVIVFTDVRPYSRLINNTCTEIDAAILSNAHG